MALKSWLFNTGVRLAKLKAEYSHKKNKPFSVTEIRTALKFGDSLLGLLQPTKKNIITTDALLGGLFCFHTQGAGVPQCTILYLHGGAYIVDLPSLANHSRYLTTEIAANCNAEIWTIDYRVAPEHPYPAAIEDAYTAYLALLEKGVPPKEIVVMGDSAGGGLSLALLMKLRDNHKPLPKAAIVISPWTDLAATGDSMVSRAASDPIFIPSLITQSAAQVVSAALMQEPYISPFYGNYAGLPPIMIMVGGRE
ncbi:MAG: alpha/beta hydrolase, partial [Pseudomonadota bacterium]|nr:alpha/beta hydrolase [Pseudomonadota bacterium]